MNILVFDIGGTYIKCGRWIDGRLSDVQEVETNAHLGGGYIMDTISSLIQRKSGYDAIGISTAGQVNFKTGSIIYANSNIPGYTGMKIKEMLETQFHVPVVVENDVNSAAVGEAVYGAGREYTSFLCLTYGTGVGGAIVEDKSVYHGSSFSAAEFGAIVTHGEDKLRGKDLFDGCYERYASAAALVKRGLEYDEGLDNGRKIFERITEPEVLNIINDWIGEVLLGLSTLIHIFNPKCVVLGGGVMEQPYVLRQIQDGIKGLIMPSFAHVEIKAAALGNQAGMLGVGHLASILGGTSKI